MTKHKPHVDDLEFEPEAAETVAGNIADKVKDLKAKLATAETKAKEYLDGWQRARADYANLQKEVGEEKIRLALQAKKSLLLDLINLADTFELARSDTANLAAVPPAWQQGFAHIHKELLNILNHHGLSVIDPLNQKFDPKLHHSIQTVPTDDPAADQTIVKVLKKGYQIAGEILRPAQVTVATLSK